MNLSPTDERSSWLPIRVASLARAHEFGLVLASQGIEASIESVPGGSVELRIPERFHRAAILHIQRYQEENRLRRWQQTIRGTGLVYDWQCFFWAVLLCAVWLLQSAQGSMLKDRGDFNSKLFSAGEWWRAFTATCLHADLEHLGSNLMTGCVFLGLAMASVGAGPALLASAIAGAAANVTGLWFHSGPYHGLGASGVVMASLGILSVQRVYWQGGQEGLRGFALRGFFCALLLLILFGFNPKSDVVVHVAGFCYGALFGLLLQPAVISSRLRLRLDLPCKLLFAAVLSLAWWKAMSPGKGSIGSL